MNVPSTIVTNLPMMSTTMTHPLLTKRFNHPPSFHRAMPHATYPWHPHQHLHRMFSTTTTSSSNSSQNEDLAQWNENELQSGTQGSQQR